MLLEEDTTGTETWDSLEDWSCPGYKRPSSTLWPVRMQAETWVRHAEAPALQLELDWVQSSTCRQWSRARAKDDLWHWTSLWQTKNWVSGLILHWIPSPSLKQEGFFPNCPYCTWARRDKSSLSSFPQHTFPSCAKTSSVAPHYGLSSVKALGLWTVTYADRVRRM